MPIPNIWDPLYECGIHNPNPEVSRAARRATTRMHYADRFEAAEKEREERERVWNESEEKKKELEQREREEGEKEEE